MSDSFATSWTVAHQAPLSMGFAKQEYWSGPLFPSPGDLPDPDIQPVLPAWQVGFPGGSCGHPWWLSGKEFTCNVGDLGSSPGSGRLPGEGSGYPFQDSCLENSMDRGA